jgi:transposase
MNFAADRGPSSNLKGVDMQVRPMHHWRAARVTAHVFLCMLVYYVEYHMRIALAPILLAHHQLFVRWRHC